MVWKADYNPFGKASITTQGPTFNLRFPGQYYDVETGLHYNWRRYYDPATGRYITSDPIGLAGGINTYAYALSNPIGNADPTGEFVPLLLGAYVAIDFALSAWDAYDTFKTITSDCATTGEKWAAGGLFAAGVILPGNYKWLGNVTKRVGGGAESVNAQSALRAKLSGLEKAQQNAATTRQLPDGRVRYYTKEVPARTEGPTRGASFVTEHNPKTGNVRQWMESYNHSGQVNRVHPKSINGQTVNSQHYPPTAKELGL